MYKLVVVAAALYFCYCVEDVLDLDWSPQDVWIASCSVDNTIVVWNALKFPGENA